MNRYKLFCGKQKKAQEMEALIHQKLQSYGYIEDHENYELSIAVGGDGTFLKMIHETNFRSDLLYLGIHAGTLGFAQEVTIDDLDNFLKELKKEDYQIDSIGIQQTTVTTKQASYTFLSLNEIVIRDAELNTLSMDVLIEKHLLEHYVGDGILVATSFGSTAYNLSFQGSIVYNTFPTLQITPIAPLNNKAYRNLLNSFIIPETKKITFVPKNKKILITVDGENHFLNDVEKIETTASKSRINCFRRKDYNFPTKINEKFLK